MDSQEQVLVGSGAHHICRGPELPVEERCILEEVGAEYLDRYDEEDEVFREGFRTAEFGYLGGGG